MARGKTLVLVGVAMMGLAALIAWLGDGTRFEGDIEIFNLCLVGLGTLAVLVGSTLLCIKAQAQRVILIGIVATVIALGVLPLASRVTGIDINLHAWSGVLFAPWILSCALGLIFILVGFLRVVL